MTENVAEMVESVGKVIDDEELSQKVIRQLLKDFGGMQIYLPRPETAFKLEDERIIYDEFDGSNMKALCRKHEITFNTFYSILRREKARRAEAAVNELDFG